MVGLVIQWIVACGIVFGGLAVAWRAAQRVGRRGGPSPHLRQLAALSLGPRRGLVVVKAGGSTVLVGFHEHGMTALGPVTDWPADAVASTPSNNAAVTPDNQRPGHSGDWLQRALAHWPSLPVSTWQRPEDSHDVG